MLYFCYCLFVIALLLLSFVVAVRVLFGYLIKLYSLIYSQNRGTYFMRMHMMYTGILWTKVIQRSTLVVRKPSAHSYHYGTCYIAFKVSINEIK